VFKSIRSLSKCGLVWVVVWDLLLSPCSQAGSLLRLQPVSGRPTHLAHVFRGEPGHLPRYDELVGLRRESIVKYLEAFQNLLLELDRQAGKKGRDEAMSWILEHLVLSATAEETGPQFCINLGVVQPIDRCGEDHGPRMHDFDTTPILSSLGADAVHCKKGEKPCSPAFGFDADGGLYCVSTNLTRACKQESAGTGTIPLADVLITCALGSPGKPRISCDALKKFYDDQTQLVEALCKDSPDHKACGILRNQMKDVFNEIQEKNKALEQSPEGKQLENLVASVNQINQPPTAEPCKGNIGANSPGASPAEATTCLKKDFPATIPPTFDKIEDALVSGADADKTRCIQLSLPDQSLLVLTHQGKDVKLVLVPRGAKGKSVSPISIGEEDAFMLEQVSNALMGSDFKTPPKDLLNSYLPAEIKADAGKMLVQSKENGKEIQLRTRGWVSANGTHVRYNPNQIFKSGDQHVLLAGVILPGEKQEHILGISTSVAE
jgi:hypothetical protein